MKFDVLVAGGEVIDAAAGYVGRFDVGIQKHRIAAVEPALPVRAAYQVIDATGQYVTPGLIDFHTHIYPLVTKVGVHADSIAWRTGVTTWVDTGSAGGFTFPGFREFIIRPANVRIYSFLNISAIGLSPFRNELANLEFCNPELCHSIIGQNRDVMVGVKVRMGASVVGPNGVEPLKRARHAADLCELPLMIHIAEAPPSIEEILSFVRPGDIISHCFTGRSMRLIDEDGRILDCAKRAWDDGAIFDVAHGNSAFSWDAAEALVSSGYTPHTISTDLSVMALDGPVFDLPTCLTKFMHLGMSLPEVIGAATTRPAELLGLSGSIGTLKPGALADLALFKVAEGRFSLYDAHRKAREAKQLLYNTMTILNGRQLSRPAATPPVAWMNWAKTCDSETRKRLQFQEQLRQLGHVPDLMIASAQRAPA